ncbi:phosphotransferase [Streptomyces sp. NPDC002671]
MHRVLAAYPLPRRVQQTRWRTEPVEDAVAKCDTVMARATRQGHDRLDQLRVHLDQRRGDLRAHVPQLREHLPETPVQQALHADLTRTNLVTLADAVTVIIDFRCASPVPAWELGRAAFEPRTLATSTDWATCALAMARTYRSEHPGLPMREVRACARIALLYMLFSCYGATTAQIGLSADSANWLNGTAGTLTTAMQGAVDDVKRQGVLAWFSNPTNDFAGKAVCGDREQVHGIVKTLVDSDDPIKDWPILRNYGLSAQSFHPKIGGARLYANSLERTMAGMRI